MYYIYKIDKHFHNRFIFGWTGTTSKVQVQSLSQQTAKENAQGDPFTSNKINHSMNAQLLS